MQTMNLLSRWRRQLPTSPIHQQVLGTIAPPVGYGKAYTPGLVKEGLMEKPEAAPITDADLEGEDSIFKRTSKWRTNTVKAPGGIEDPNGGLFGNDDPQAALAQT